ncbi:MAG: hypothetical protein ABUL58_01160 [Steroidobacter sp.]
MKQFVTFLFAALVLINASAMPRPVQNTSSYINGSNGSQSRYSDTHETAAEMQRHRPRHPHHPRHPRR